MQLNTRLKKAYGITTKQAAEMCGIDTQHFRRLEKKRNNRMFQIVLLGLEYGNSTIELIEKIERSGFFIGKDNYSITRGCGNAELQRKLNHYKIGSVSAMAEICGISRAYLNKLASTKEGKKLFDMLFMGAVTYVHLPVIEVIKSHYGVNNEG